MKIGKHGKYQNSSKRQTTTGDYICPLFTAAHSFKGHEAWVAVMNLNNTTELSHFHYIPPSRFHRIFLNQYCDNTVTLL